MAKKKRLGRPFTLKEIVNDDYYIETVPADILTARAEAVARETGLKKPQETQEQAKSGPLKEGE